jgi:exodeoxyribonuclease VII large subunit
LNVLHASRFAAANLATFSYLNSAERIRTSNFSLMSDQQQIFTLKQVVSSIRKTIEERYQRAYWVKAEMHKLNRYPSGHCFPELLQKEDGRIVAQISGSIWSHNFDRINKRFIEVVKEPLKEDTTLLMQVKVSFHEMYGISLQIQDIDPNYTLGELHKERAETLKKLEKENLINANQQLTFPLLPQRVAVISADSSKGLSDFMQVLEENSWEYKFFTMLFPAYLQGDQAADSIISQLNRIERVIHHFDIVVIVRGGGGEVGLSCYNNYDLCKAIAKFPIPVLTGIGHSTNLTVAEMISFRNAITPTELGEFLLQSFHNFSVPLKDSVKSLKIFSERKLKDEAYLLSKESNRFNSAAQRLLQVQTQLMSKYGNRLVSGSKTNVRNNQHLLETLKHGVVSQARQNILVNRNRIDGTVSQIPFLSGNLIERSQAKLEQLEHRVRLLDPINTLNRGYSITTFNGKTISETNEVEEGTKIQTRTAKFTLESTVTKKESNE